MHLPDWALCCKLFPDFHVAQKHQSGPRHICYLFLVLSIILPNSERKWIVNYVRDSFLIGYRSKCFFRLITASGVNWEECITWTACRCRELLFFNLHNESESVMQNSWWTPNMPQFKMSNIYLHFTISFYYFLSLHFTISFLQKHKGIPF